VSVPSKSDPAKNRTWVMAAGLSTVAVTEPVKGASTIPLVGAVRVTDGSVKVGLEPASPGRVTWAPGMGRAAPSDHVPWGSPSSWPLVKPSLSESKLTASAVVQARPERRKSTPKSFRSGILVWQVAQLLTPPLGMRPL